eukprot:m.105753 g.105753  ORF g.105753 m.105753 type:complete len:375 (-) comp15130_c0_seq2:574-1698(-)
MSRSSSATAKRRVVSSASARDSQPPNMMTVLSSGNEFIESSSRPASSASRPTSGRHRIVRSSATEGGMAQLSGPPMAEKPTQQQNNEDKALARALDKIRRLDQKLNDIAAREKSVKKDTQALFSDSQVADEEDIDPSGEEEEFGSGFFATQPPEDFAVEDEQDMVENEGDDDSATRRRLQNVMLADQSTESSQVGKGSHDDLIQRNIKLAADGRAGVLALTPEEKERLNDLLADLDTIDESVAAVTNPSSSSLMNPFSLDSAMEKLQEIDQKLNAITQGRRSLMPSAIASEVATELPGFTNAQSKVREAIRSEDNEVRQQLSLIDQHLARLREPIGEAETVDERTLELLMMEGMAEQAYLDQLEQDQMVQAQST